MVELDKNIFKLQKTLFYFYFSGEHNKKVEGSWVGSGAVLSDSSLVSTYILPGTGIDEKQYNINLFFENFHFKFHSNSY